MNFTNRLCNPTPFTAKIPFHAGIKIVVPADGHVDLSADQARDFQKGQPGSEAVQDLLRSEGLFILDLDRSYEVQAQEALQAASTHLLSRYSDMVNRLRRSRAAEGISENPEAFDEIVRQTGYAALKERADAMKARAEYLGRELAKTKEVVTAQKLDPEKTLPFTNPMRVFPSALALQMFLRDKGNEDLKVKWEKWYAETTRPAKTVKKDAEVN